jgi:hypothetical protein
MGILADLCMIAAAVLRARVEAARKSLGRLVFGCALFCAGVLFLIAGIGLMTWGVYALLTPAAGAIGAAFITGALLLVIALNVMICAWLINR